VGIARSHPRQAPMASILARYTAQFPHHLGSQASWLAAPWDGSHPAGYACVGPGTPFRHTPLYHPDQCLARHV